MHISKETIRRIELDEGFRSHAYLDSVGIPTIGHGYNLITNPQSLPKHQLLTMCREGISEVSSKALVLAHLAVVQSELTAHIWFWGKLSEERQGVLYNMTYNLGIQGLLKFKRMLAAMEAGNYTSAEGEMLDSRWATQVGNRAKRLAKQMGSNE